MNENYQKPIRDIARLCLAVAVLLAAAFAATDGHACPTCKQGLGEDDPATQAMAAGYFYSILFMMSMPFLIVGTFGSFAYLSIRRARARLDSSVPTDVNM